MSEGTGRSSVGGRATLRPEDEAAGADPIAEGASMKDTDQQAQEAAEDYAAEMAYERYRDERDEAEARELQGPEDDRARQADEAQAQAEADEMGPFLGGGDWSRA